MKSSPPLVFLFMSYMAQTQSNPIDVWYENNQTFGENEQAQYW